MIAGCCAAMVDDDPRTLSEFDGSLSEATVSEATPGEGARAVALGPGVRLGHYELERLIGTGGMGEVYAARDLDDGAMIALKSLSKTSATHLYRFKREFRALADVSHPNLIGLRELVVAPGSGAYFTMELVDGRSFVEWVRAGVEAGALPGLDRLGLALEQLVLGVEHLHRIGCVHRDLKPSNVLVSERGRVVILDFGLVSEFTEPELGVTADGQLLGTPLYMAPEQAASEQAGPAADLYAIGVMLYECLTGQAPFEGAALQLMMLKQTQAAPDPGAVCAGIPEPLREACRALLARDPAQRPSCASLLAQLGSYQAPGSPGSSGSPGASGSPGTSGSSGKPALAPYREPTFVGRASELQELRQAFDALRFGGGGVVVHLCGAGGLGKSALLLRSRAALGSGPTVLHGRCRERESMPYKGVDAIIDALSVALRRLPRDQRDALAPRDRDALTRVFPVLDELWGPGAPQLLGPNELRSLAWNALRELLVRLSKARPLVVHIDDFHWTDADSVRLLEALTTGPEPPAMLLVLGYRLAQASSTILALGGRGARRIELGPLDPCAAQALASELLREREGEAGEGEAGQVGQGDPTARARRAEALALRSAGNPLFIGQLIRGGVELSGDRKLEDYIAHHITELPPTARRVLELVAVSGGPLESKEVLGLCPEASGEQIDAHIDALCRLDLLVRGEAPRLVVEVTHDRIRELILAELEAPAAAGLHRALAARLLAAHPEPEAEILFKLVDHLGAGFEDLQAIIPEQRLELAGFNRRAGELALAATAWEPARRYLGVALGLLEPWMAEARAGRGPQRELCLAVCYGHAKARAMCEGKAADPAFDELLSWSLSTAEYGEIVAHRLGLLVVQDRQVETVHGALAALRHLGVRVPEHPSFLRCVLALARGAWAMGRADLNQLRALPQLVDTRARAVMDIIAASLGSAVIVDARLYMTLAGIFAGMIRRYGFHERTTYALSALAYGLNRHGRPREAASLCERALALAEHEPGPAESLIAARALALLFVWPSTRPFPVVLEQLRPTHDRACELGLRRTAAYRGFVGAGLQLEAGTPLPEVLATLDHAQARNPGLGSDEYRKFASLQRSYIRGLVLGTAVIGADELGALYQLTRATCVLFELVQAVCFGEFERASSCALRFGDAYEQRLSGGWGAPRFATLGAIALAERHALAASGAERRALRRHIRQRHALVARHARRCPDNYAAMLALIEGERRALRGREDAAIHAYERARTLAAKRAMHDLVALASQRLERLYHKRCQDFAAGGARSAAIEAYGRWGAAAVVDRLEAGVQTLESSQTMPLPLPGAS